MENADEKNVAIPSATPGGSGEPLTQREGDYITLPPVSFSAVSADPRPIVAEPTPIDGRLRHAPLRVPECYDLCNGFTLFGRRIKSLLYSTDVAAIRNSNADAIFAVYPFTAQPAITQALLTVAEAPLFVGVGGGTTTGRRAVELAAVSEMQGAAGVVLNSPATVEMVAQISESVDIPVIASVTQFDAETIAKIEAGARVINVAAGKNTAAVIRDLRGAYPTLPIIATGGKSDEASLQTIHAGANALIWAPPSTVELQKDMMARYRQAAEPAPAAAAVDDAVAADAAQDSPVAATSEAAAQRRGFISPFRGRLPFQGRRRR